MQICLGFRQRERVKVQMAGQAVMQSSLVADDILHHPRSCASADDKQQVLLHAAPAVPKQVDGLQKLRLLGVHPRQLVQEHHLAALTRLLDNCLEQVEGLVPILGLLWSPLTISANRLVEIL